MGAPPHMGAALHGRDEVIGRVLDVRHAKSIVTITGPAGVGRSAILAHLRTRLDACGVHTAEIRITRDERDLTHLVTRLADELGVPSAPEAGRNPLMRLLAQSAEHHGPLVVLVDDAQRIAPDCLTELARLAAPEQTGLVTFVCAFRTPSTGAHAELPLLHNAGLVHQERLRPLSQSAVRALLTERLQAQPAPRLVRAVRRSSRGLPAFAHAIIDGNLDADCLRVVDRWAYPIGGWAPRVRITHPLFAGLGELGSPCWPVVKALALLHPLRGNIPALIAEACDLHEIQVLDTLEALRAAGVLLNGWRFRIPALAMLLTACLGPYEQRRVSEIAVLALWNGTVTCADPEYLAQRLTVVGKLVDSDRATAELMEHSDLVRPERGDLADLWGRAAVRLSTDSAQRAAILHRHATTSALHLRWLSAAESAEEALRAHPDQLTPDSVQELEIVSVVATANTGILADLVPEKSAVAHRTVTRAAALCLLDRWWQAHEELTTDHELWSSSGTTTALFGQVLQDVTASVLGHTPPQMAAPIAPPESETATDALRILTRSLTLYGKVDGSDRRPMLPPHQQTPGELAVRYALAGQWDEALDHARTDLATASAWETTPGNTTLFRELSDILIARGQLDRARAVIEDARAQPLLLPHLLAAAEAEMEFTTGAEDSARARLSAGLSAADANGVLFGTDELLLGLVDVEIRRGDQAEARRYAERLERTAAQLGTVSARRNQLLGRVLVQRDTTAAEEVVELVTARERPFELARTLSTVASSELGTEKTLYAAYELFGELDALIPRARLRLMMRTRKVTIPGRGTTVAENERLLATLIAEGLTNAQLATILGGSEKGVEGRLTRLFQRAGYRSRAELATAVLNGDFSG